MFKHILIATDGSKLAAKSVKVGVKLARALGARVTAVSVAQPYLATVYSDATLYMTAGAVADYEKATKAQAARALAAVERAAEAASVRATTRIVGELQPWRGSLKAARKAGCDAIVIASHGHGGLGAAILGSQTSRVLSHSKIPVLVIR